MSESTDDAKSEIIFQCRNLHARLKKMVPEILDEIQRIPLWPGSFRFHEDSKKWGYSILAASELKDSEFVVFSIHADRSDHIRFIFYGHPDEFASHSDIPISGDRPSYSTCVFDRFWKKEPLLGYLKKSYELWNDRVHHLGLL
jgi:hypothetical protein